jgi:hypothetical protein
MPLSALFDKVNLATCSSGDALAIPVSLLGLQILISVYDQHMVWFVTCAHLG